MHLGLGQVLFQGLLIEVAHPAKKVQLIGSDPYSDRIHFAGAVLAAAEGSLLGPGAICTDIWKEFGALDAVLGLEGFHIQGCFAQVAVIGKRSGDDLLQGRIRIKGGPADLADISLCRCSGIRLANTGCKRQVGRHRHIRPGILWGQAATEKGAGHQPQGKRLEFRVHHECSSICLGSVRLWLPLSCSVVPRPPCLVKVRTTTT